VTLETKVTFHYNTNKTTGKLASKKNRQAGRQTGYLTNRQAKTTQEPKKGGKTRWKKQQKTHSL
jgi:hypothetical protein